MLGLSRDLLEQLAFYGSYHRNRWNQLIHFVFVPLIVVSAMVWACYTGPLFGINLPDLAARAVPESIAQYCVFNLAAIILAAYAVFYLTLDFFAGITWAALVAVPMLFIANIMHQDVSRAWAWALAAHMLGWYMQIHPGHLVLEKRKPALMDSFLQSLVLAPLFVWFELLFLLGYRPQLYAQLQDRVAANTETLHSSVKDVKQPLLAEQLKT